MRFLFVVKGVKLSWKKNAPCVFCSWMRWGRRRGLSCCSSGLFSVTSSGRTEPFSAGGALREGIHSTVVWDTTCNLMLYPFVSGQMKT